MLPPVKAPSNPLKLKEILSALICPKLLFKTNPKGKLAEDELADKFNSFPAKISPDWLIRLSFFKVRLFPATKP